MAAPRGGTIVTKAADKQTGVYDMYKDYSEPVSKLVPHRVLAINRGEKQKVLSVKLDADTQAATDIVQSGVLRSGWQSRYMETAAEDAYKRLIFPSIERELRSELSEAAEEQAIKVFGENLKNLLLAPPCAKDGLGLDPGYRTGNKAAVVDPTGRVLDTAVIYMTLEHHDTEKAKKQLAALIEKHGVDIIAIGNGTASKKARQSSRS